MKRLSILLSLSCLTISNAQNQGKIWYFGDHAGVDFNTTPPSALTNGKTDFLSPIMWNEAYSSISNSNGQLLFYSNGAMAWNNTHSVMPNGSGLQGHRSSSKGCLIVPQPGHPNLFYLFTNDALENNFQNGLKYSIVDMCLDNGKGDVVSNAKNISLYPSAAERLVGVAHSNGTDYWILTHKMNSDEFCAFKLTSSGITTSVTSNCGPVDAIGWAEMSISPNGQKIAYCMPTAVSSVVTSFMADFDPGTGAVSNAQILSYGGREYSACFSPDNTKLYFGCAGIGNLFQYNLNAGNLSSIIASKNYLFQNGFDQWRHMANGPDGNIYISRTGKKYLSCITTPNTLYPGCTYVDSLISLNGQTASHGLPNFVAAFQYSNSATYTNPTISVNGGTICAGSAFTLSPTGAMSYSYSGGSAVVNPTVTTTYTVTGSNTVGCTASAQATVLVHASPLITVNSGSICLGDTFHLVPGGAATYTIGGGTANVSPAVTSTYVVAGTNSLGCVSMTPAISVVSVLPLPTLTVSASPVLICKGGTSLLGATGAVSYTWSPPIPPSGFVSPSSTTIYTVTGADANGCRSTANQTISVDICEHISDRGEIREPGISIFPNPTSGVFRLNLSEPAKVTIYNELGVLIYQKEQSLLSSELCITDFPRGIYYLKAGSLVKKLVKE